MVIGNDEVNAEAMRGLGGGEGANAGVNADDEMNSGGGGALNHIAAEIITFLDAVRHVEVGGAATELNCGFEDYDRGRAVDVVVAVNQDAFFALDGCV